MNKSIILICAPLVLLWSCGPGKDKPDGPPSDSTAATSPSFTLTVTEATSFPKLPPLQSYVLGVSGNDWIMFSGRTNGFHGFSAPNMNFPKLSANSYIYVYDNTAQQLDSIPVPPYGGDTGNVFLSTNLAHTVKDGYLYACGGYGIANAAGTTAKKTYSYFMQMQLTGAIAAVKAHDGAAFKKSILWGQSPLVCATGGELFKLADNNFYMCVGHNFTGNYSDSSAQQVYVNAVNVFKTKEFQLNQHSKKFLILEPLSTITDGLPNTTTQFHRRDLVIAPNVLANGSNIGLAIYGGVFTYTGGAPASNSGTPFAHPIYIDNTQPTPFRVDSFNQWTNIYSTAFMTMYDSHSQSMMTTLFGGLGDSQANFASANWTNIISTNIRSYANGGDITTSYPNSSTLPAFMGSEGIFIPAAGIPLYQGNQHDIIDYAALGNSQTIGYIYGGIVSNQCCNDTTGSTWPSPKIYQVILNKTTAAAKK